MLAPSVPALGCPGLCAVLLATWVPVQGLCWLLGLPVRAWCWLLGLARLLAGYLGAWCWLLGLATWVLATWVGCVGAPLGLDAYFGARAGPGAYCLCGACWLLGWALVELPFGCQCTALVQLATCCPCVLLATWVPVQMQGLVVGELDLMPARLVLLLATYGGGPGEVAGCT